MQVAVTLGWVMSPCTVTHSSLYPNLCPLHSCVPFSIFSPGGARCEQLAVSLAAFISILVGALALLCLLLSIACLAAHLCRRRQELQG